MRERLADLYHSQWSDWMKYLFDKCEWSRGVPLIPPWAVARWKRQMNTPYAELSEEEKEKDRKEADKYLALIGQRVSDLSGLNQALKSMSKEPPKPPEGPKLRRGPAAIF